MIYGYYLNKYERFILMGYVRTKLQSEVGRKKHSTFGKFTFQFAFRGRKFTGRWRRRFLMRKLGLKEGFSWVILMVSSVFTDVEIYQVLHNV